MDERLKKDYEDQNKDALVGFGCFITIIIGIITTLTLIYKFIK